MQYLSTAFAFSISKPFKNPIYTNFLLLFFLTFGFIYSLEIIIYPDPWSKDLLIIDDINLDFRLYLGGFVILNLVLCELVERFLIPCFSGISNRRHLRKLNVGILDFESLILIFNCKIKP